MFGGAYFAPAYFGLPYFGPQTAVIARVYGDDAFADKARRAIYAKQIEEFERKYSRPAPPRKKAKERLQELKASFAPLAEKLSHSPAKPNVTAIWRGLERYEDEKIEWPVLMAIIHEQMARMERHLRKRRRDEEATVALYLLND